MYVYIRTEPSLWTVGFYDPQGRWQPESDWNSPEEAANRVHYLNGNCDENTPSVAETIENNANADRYR